MTLDKIRSWLTENLPALCAENNVVGAQVGVLAGDEMVDAAAGVLNQRTGVSTTPESVFQIGSITKLWTTTLIMQLVDEGRVHLDDPVRAYLPEFRVQDEDASAAISVRQLLSHTSGFEGDVFVSTGTGADAVATFVDAILPGVRQTSVPGELFSYNNAGFVTLGRIVEVLRGMPYNNALRKHIVEPLKLDTVSTRADEAILHSAAVGHIRHHSSKPLEPTKVWALQASNAPAGSMLSMSTRDLLRLVRAIHGGEVMSSTSLGFTLTPQVDVPDIPRYPAQWGLGWMLFDWDGVRVIGHDGGTIGQAATLRIVPEPAGGPVAVAILTNGGGAAGLREAVMSHVFGALAAAQPPPALAPPTHPADVEAPSRYVGSYEAGLSRYDVTPGDNGDLKVRITALGEIAEMAPSEPEEFSIVRRENSSDSFVSTRTFDGGHLAVCFIGDDGHGRAKYLHNGRALPRQPHFTT